MLTNRGEIYNVERASQLRDYSGLRFGNITPTDIDGIIEYRNKAYAILELKYGDNRMPDGQKLALERLTDDLELAGKKTLCIIATHFVVNPDESIDAANTVVTSYRYHGKWRLGTKGLLTKELITRFFNFIKTPEESPYFNTGECQSS